MTDTQKFLQMYKGICNECDMSWNCEHCEVNRHRWTLLASLKKEKRRGKNSKQGG